jgi:5'-3' exonuclease
LLDGTYELFRGFYGPPPRQAPDGREVGATVGMLRSLIALLGSEDVTHVGCAFDHEVTSFRNELYEGYKTGEGIDPKLLGQFSLAEEAVAALGIVVWPMVEYEADDALATAATRFGGNPELEQIVICSPDKDLAQLVDGERIVCWDRRREIVYDETAVIEKYGVPPAAIADWLALVGDKADGIPGIRGWGAKSAAALLNQFGQLDAIPEDTSSWNMTPGRAQRLANSLFPQMKEALLYRRLTTLRTDVPLEEKLDELCWTGPSENFRQFCADLGVPDLPDRVPER